MTRTRSILALMLVCSPSLLGCDGEPVAATDAGADASAPRADASAATDASATTDGGATGGCGLEPERVGPEYVVITSGGIERRFYLRVLDGYDPSRPAPLVFGVHGRDYDGIRMRDYLGLEPFAAPGTIFVYPDALQRDWDGFTAIGWQNGPIPSTYDGVEDLAFIDDVLAWVEQRYCVDRSRVFVTGQSWGGDFSSVLGCYRGDVFRAFVGVAANDPYYLPVDDDRYPCVGETAAWILHGKADEYFPVAVGERVRDFWLAENECEGGTTPIVIEGSAADDECVEHAGCAQRTRYCSYTAATGHQVPFDWYARETMRFFESFAPLP